MTQEKIVKIQEASFKTDRKNWEAYDGYEIATTKQIIKLGIANVQSCCEQWGFFMSEDDFADFIGAQLRKIEVVDTALNTTEAKLKDEGVFEYGATMFVNIETSKGVLQFTAYNSHNGYYGHDAIVVSEQLNHRESL